MSSCSACVSAARCFHCRTVAVKSSTSAPGGYPRNHSRDRRGLDRNGAPRRLNALGCGVKLGLQCHRVGQRDIDRRIAARVHRPFDQPDHGETVAPETDRLADQKSGLAVCHQFEMACADAAPLGDALRAARMSRLIADDVEPQRCAGMGSLDVLEVDRAGLGHARHPRHSVARGQRDVRGFGERPLGAALDHPDIRRRSFHDSQGIGDKTVIDADH